MNLKNNCACYECGKKYLTESQINSNTHNQTTYFKATCMVCREEKGVTDIRSFNGLRKLPVDIESYHGGKIMKNEIVFCDIYFERETGKKISKKGQKEKVPEMERETIHGAIYKYDKGRFKRLGNTKDAIKHPAYDVKVLDIKVIHRMGFGKG